MIWNHLRRLGGLFLVTVAVSACAVKVPAPLTTDQRATYRIDKVVVSVPETADIWWGSGDRAVARAASVDTTDAEATGTYLKTPEGKAALYSHAGDEVQRVLDDAFRNTLAGDRPAQLSVVVTDIFVASAAQQVVFGGSHTMWGGVQLFDLETGEALTGPQRMFGFGGGGSGIITAVIDAARANTPLGRTVLSFAGHTQKWLLASSEVELPITESQNVPVAGIPQPVIAPKPELVDAAPSS